MAESAQQLIATAKLLERKLAPLPAAAQPSSSGKPVTYLSRSLKRATFQELSAEVKKYEKIIAATNIQLTR